MSRPFVLVLVIVALLFGVVFGNFVGKGERDPQSLQGSQKVVDNTLSYNRFLNQFPDTYWEFIEGNGFVLTDPLVVVQWPKKDTPFEDTPSDILMLLEFDKLPFSVEFSDEEVCEFENSPGFDPICFFPPQDISWAVWPQDWPDGWFWHPGMPADNPEHGGVGHPALLVFKKNLEGPLQYPADFEAKYPGFKLAP
ncbi:hypothetical protein IIB97_01230 [Patescibacteria group bacterium]|nr:hypothetical protein [Patescibacteria group bacterium]